LSSRHRTVLDIFAIPYSPVDDFLKKLRNKKLKQIKK